MSETSFNWAELAAKFPDAKVAYLSMVTGQVKTLALLNPGVELYRVQDGQPTLFDKRLNSITTVANRMFEVSEPELVLAAKIGVREADIEKNNQTERSASLLAELEGLREVEPDLAALGLRLRENVFKELLK
jgi:hypothetical protein